ncbi:MAG: asparagine synthase (glutamine-hydrolyzing) [Verrucomicrobiales bacterium]|jgi:asparagine synthase (glutamine-hydrolysing)
MCGIAGYISESQPIEPSAFNRMRDTLIARGPDGADSKFFREGRVALGHRRLAIVDLSEAGAQPMCNETGDVWLTYNGELYNHETLRTELERLGHRYNSTCDAETIIHAYEEWGDQCVLRFRGIFAFAIWDSRTGRLFCARDHLGVKPFYYLKTSEALIFGSQPKAICAAPNFKPKADPSAFADYLFFGIVPHDRALFEGVKKLPPGHQLVYEDGSIAVKQYWKVQYQPEIRDFDEAVSLVGDALESAVSLQLMSDVPYGSYLSGGIDSSLITAIAAKSSGSRIPSITVGFDDKKRDERPFAQLVADHCQTDHHENVLNYKTAMGLVDELAEIYDEPYALGAALPLVFIAKKTRELGLKVVLAGDGADELFAGYRHYDQMQSASDPYASYQPHEAFIHTREEMRMAGSAIPDDCQPEWRFRQFYPNGLPSTPAAQVLDAKTYLPDEILVKVDRATMAEGVEARVPFLDPNLVELAFKIDSSLTYRAGERKALLKAVARKWLPDSVLTQRKKGFSIPIRRWLLRPANWLRMVKTVWGGMLIELKLIDGAQFKRKGAFLPPVWLWKLYIAELWARRWL